MYVTDMETPHRYFSVEEPCNMQSIHVRKYENFLFLILPVSVSLDAIIKGLSLRMLVFCLNIQWDLYTYFTNVQIQQEIVLI